MNHWAFPQALGLKNIVDFSWETVQKEKPDIIHLLDFPYNGETRKDQLLEGKLTDNKFHLFVYNPLRSLDQAIGLMISKHSQSRWCPRH